MMAAESALLRKHGHEVYHHTVSNDRIQGVWQKIVTAWQAPYSSAAKREVSDTIKEVNPDIVHSHNSFPLLTSSIYEACREAGVPVVQTLHNFRNICPGAILLREGKVCENCIQGTPYHAVLHKCYRDSRLGSLAVARMVDFHRRRGTWNTQVDRFIVMTKLAKSKFVEAGFPEGKIAIKSNFVEDISCQQINGEDRLGALYVGRLSHEKGIDTINEAWKNLDIPLRIIGEGPLLNFAQKNAVASINFLGAKEMDQVIQEMSRSKFLVMPSKCYEGFPLVLLEAFSQGLPAIASRMGAMLEMVEDGVTGLHFEPGDAVDLARKVRWATEHPEEMRRMGRTARRVYEEKFTPETNYLQLMAIYQEAIMEGRRS